MSIVNLTQHKASAEQVVVGVIDLENSEKLKELLNFNDIPSIQEIERRANEIAEIAIQSGCRFAMIGGAPYLMSALERALLEAEIKPVYAFSTRVSEEHEENGKVIKTIVFKHLGFVET